MHTTNWIVIEIIINYMIFFIFFESRHHHNGRWEARIGRVFGNKYLYLGTYGTFLLSHTFVFVNGGCYFFLNFQWCLFFFFLQIIISTNLIRILITHIDWNLQSRETYWQNPTYSIIKHEKSLISNLIQIRFGAWTQKRPLNPSSLTKISTLD